MRLFTGGESAKACWLLTISTTLRNEEGNDFLVRRTGCAETGLITERWDMIHELHSCCVRYGEVWKPLTMLHQEVVDSSRQPFTKSYSIIHATYTAMVQVQDSLSAWWTAQGVRCTIFKSKSEGKSKSPPVVMGRVTFHQKGLTDF